jgi:hypothetical protein
MTLRSFAKLVFLAVLSVPVAAAARQTFKPAELAKVDFNTDVAPHLELTTESGLPLPARLRFESKMYAISARAQVARVTYTKAGLSIEMSGGSYTERTGNFATTDTPFQTLQLEFSSNGELVSAKPR